MENQPNLLPLASVKKFPGCKYWYACFAQFTGDWHGDRPVSKRVQRTTMLTDKANALTLALQFESQSHAAVTNTWNQHHANSLILQIRAITEGAPAQVETIDEAIKRWVEQAQHSDAKGSKTLKNYRSIENYFRAFLGARQARPINELTAPLIISFRDEQKASGKSVSTVNKSLGVIKQILDSAMSKSTITEHPFNAPGSKIFLSRNKKSAQKRRAFPFAQFQQLVAATEPEKQFSDRIDLTPEWQTFITITGYTGGRQQEPAKLRWENVNFERSILRLDTTKTSDEHFLPLHPAAEKHLKSIKPARAHGPIMPQISRLSVQRISKTFREVILPRIGIIQPYDTKQSNPKKGSGRIIPKYSFHSLRHGLSTWLNELGVSDATRMAIVGHDNTEVSLGYTHVDLTAAREGLGKVPDVFTGTTSKL